MIHLVRQIFEICEVVVLKVVSEDLILVIYLAIWVVAVHRRDLSLILGTFLGISHEVVKSPHESRRIMMILKKRVSIWSKSSSSPSGISYSGQKSPSIHRILANSR